MVVQQRKEKKPVLKSVTDFLKEAFLLTFGTLLVSVGIYFFKFPNNFSTGGVSGISVLLGALVPDMTSGTFVLILNVLLLVIGFAFLDRRFGLRTVYCSLLLSLSIYIFEKLIPLTHPLTTQPFLELTFSVLLPAVGSAILFNFKASTGGTDIVAVILKRYTGLNVGKSLLCVDVLIAVSAGLVFGLETGLFSLLGLIAKAIVVDNVIEGINVSKLFLMITDQADAMSEYINTELGRGATVCDCVGAFSSEKRKLILTVVRRGQAVQLKEFAKSVDKSAFIVILTSSNILGKGFRDAGN